MLARLLLWAALLVGPVSGQYRPSPMSYPGSTEWTVDETVSDQFAGNWFNVWRWYNAFYEPDCTVAMMNQGKCTASWNGLAPTLIAPSQLKQQGGRLEITLQTSTGNSAAFAAANNNDTAPGGCNCEYGGLVTGLLKSRALVRGGYVEARLRMPDHPDVVGSVWLQGDNVEISAVGLRGARLTTGAYIFDEDATTSEHEVSSAVPDPSGGTATYGFEWKRNDDLVVHVDGAELHTLHGADWNPGGKHAAQQLNLMVDLQLAPGVDPAAAMASGPATLELDDLTV